VGNLSEQVRGFSMSVISFDGAATSVSIPAVRRCRARPNPVGPASYVALTGCGNEAIHAVINGSSQSRV